VSLYAELADQYVVVRLEISPVDPELANSQENDQSLSVARQLISACGGKIDAGREGTAFVLAITLPIVKQFTILVFDDNEDVLDLLQRYTSGTRFRIHGAHDVEQALISAEKCRPQAILLDVMMPRIGGWEALGRLRNHPLTQHIPVIICTILPERELALSLGASGFIHKPFTRTEFLAALDREIGQAAQERD
jgi:CheY-like chemotaxis protein